MDNRTIGNLLSGFGAKAIAASAALYVASYAGIAVLEFFARAQAAFNI